MTGESQFIRRWGLFVADPSGGAGVAIAEGTDEPGRETLHVRFEIHQADSQNLANHGTIKVWNPPEDLIGKLRQYVYVTLQAGYRDGKYGTIFRGWISYFRYGHESPVDSYVELYVTDGDLGVNFATINRVLAPGANAAVDQTKAVSDALAAKGVEAPSSVPAGGPSQPRPTVLWGSVSDQMENVRKTNDWLWSVQNGKLVVTESNVASAGEGVVLNASTGLIGWPTVVSDGVEARCLLNPGIYVKQRVKIDNASVNRTTGTGLGTNGNEFQAIFPSATAGIAQFAPTSADGEYVAFVVEFRGDTRGNEWYTDLVLWAIDSKTGATLTQDGRVPTDGQVSTEVNASISRAFGALGPGFSGT